MHIILIIKHHKILIDKKLICLKINNGDLDFIKILVIKSWFMEITIKFMPSLEYGVRLCASKTSMNRDKNCN